MTAQKKVKISSDSKGRCSEFVASIYFRILGYKIISKRYKTKFGEIDLIIERGHNVIFVEVKYRKNQNDAIFAISNYQKSRIRSAAAIFISNFSHTTHKRTDYRFDALLLSNFKILHIKNAF